MATLHKEIFVSASCQRVWDAIRDVGSLHTRLVPGLVVDCHLEEGGVRVVTFSNGVKAREPIVSLDDTRRRLAWQFVGATVTHCNGVMEVVEEGGGCRVLWTSDLLPHEAAHAIGAFQDQALQVLKATIEATLTSSYSETS